MSLDRKLVDLLGIDPHGATMKKHGGSGFASTWKITTKLTSGESKSYFMKTGKGADAETMFQGEHESLEAIRQCVPTLCPKSYGHGKLADSPAAYFLVTDFFDTSGRSNEGNGVSLAKKLGKLHTTPAPTPDGYDQPQFGFPSTTCCGETPQDNTYSSSWADFYANRRLRFIVNRSEKTNGPDGELSSLTETLCSKVVPRLLGDSHLNNSKPITPVVIHGDLWSGNATWGKLPSTEGSEQIVFDSSACYAHSEFELGIMRMFGGFGKGFMDEYHKIVPKTEPVDEYEDRVALYELYHHLNHHAMFGGGYRSGAVSIIRRLISKYGNE